MHELAFKGCLLSKISKVGGVVPPAPPFPPPLIMIISNTQNYQHAAPNKDVLKGKLPRFDKCAALF